MPGVVIHRGKPSVVFYIHMLTLCLDTGQLSWGHPESGENNAPLLRQPYWIWTQQLPSTGYYNPPIITWIYNSHC